MIKTTKYAPITLFVYKRPWHTRQTVEALQRNDLAAESELFIYSDGPKTGTDREGVADVREYVKSIGGFKRVAVIARERNIGLARSVIAGVSELCDKYGRVIVIEDDLVTLPYFLDYMNNALNLYENDEKVMQVSGHMFPVELNTDSDAVFLPFTTSWGWATWQRAWRHFDSEMKGYEKLRSDRALRKKFDLDGAYPYYKMLENQRRGRVDSWAIVWYLSVFILDGLTLFPRETLIQNIGFDGSGTHMPASQEVHCAIRNHIKAIDLPARADISEHSFSQIKKFLKGNNSCMRLMNIIKKMATK